MSKEDRAMEAARMLRDFCGEWDCTVCPFITDEDGIQVCCLDAPLNWELPNKKPAGVRAPTSCEVDSFDPITSEDNTKSEV